MPNTNSSSLVKSDLFDYTVRPNGYPSYYYDVHSKATGQYPLINYDVSFECHQSVLNEISTKPSNFGYGLGVALRRALDFVANSFKSCRKHGNEMLESEGEQAECDLAKIQECVDATDALVGRLNAVEQAQEEQYNCLRQRPMSEREAREIQWIQRPEAHPHLFNSHFNSVQNACYRERGGLPGECHNEFVACREAGYEAEGLERAQVNACSR
jgi:hypothetical protein